MCALRAGGFCGYKCGYKLTECGYMVKKYPQQARPAPAARPARRRRPARPGTAPAARCLPQLDPHADAGQEHQHQQSGQQARLDQRQQLDQHADADQEQPRPQRPTVKSL